MSNSASDFQDMQKIAERLINYPEEFDQLEPGVLDSYWLANVITKSPVASTKINWAAMPEDILQQIAVHLKNWGQIAKARPCLPRKIDKYLDQYSQVLDTDNCEVEWIAECPEEFYSVMPDHPVEEYIRKNFGIVSIDGTEGLVFDGHEPMRFDYLIGMYVLKSRVYKLFVRVMNRGIDGPYSVDESAIAGSEFFDAAVKSGLVKEWDGYYVLPDYHSVVVQGNVPPIALQNFNEALERWKEVCLGWQDIGAPSYITLSKEYDELVSLGAINAAEYDSCECAQIPEFCTYDPVAQSCDYDPDIDPSDYTACDWVMKLASTDERIMLPEGITFDVDQWDEIVWHQPTRAKDCPCLENLSPYTWCHILEAHAATDALCPFEKFKGVHWLLLNSTRPDIASRCDMACLTECQREAWGKM